MSDSTIIITKEDGNRNYLWIFCLLSILMTPTKITCCMLNPQMKKVTSMRRVTIDEDGMIGELFEIPESA